MKITFAPISAHYHVRVHTPVFGETCQFASEETAQIYFAFVCAGLQAVFGFTLECQGEGYDLLHGGELQGEVTLTACKDPLCKVFEGKLHFPTQQVAE